MADYANINHPHCRESRNGRWLWVGFIAVIALLWGVKKMSRPPTPSFADQQQTGSGPAVAGPVGATTFVVGAAAPGAAARTPRTITPRGDMDDDEVETIQLFRKCAQSVVFITTIVRGLDRLTMNPVEIPSGTGSGFVWDKEGHVVTNYHVVEGSEASSRKIKVVLSDQSAWPAELIGKAINRDIAVLKLDAPPEKLAALRPISLGTSSDLIVGQNVYAIGNPFGLDQTLTTGIISGLERMIRGRNDQKIEGLIQTDAAINPGNSGGPLLDSAGRLIGVNTAIYSPSGAYAGVGFAIPVDNVNRMVPRLIYRKVDGPALGIMLLPAEITRQLRIRGVIVKDVTPNGTADRAGLKPTVISRDGDIDLGDVIVRADDVRVLSTEDLFDFLDSHEVGDEVTITVIRDVETRQPQQLELKARLLRQSFDN